MANGKETVSRTLIVALVLSIVFSVVVSTAAVVLRPAQIKNQNLDMDGAWRMEDAIKTDI